MEFITLTKDDPEFESYLRGTFSRELRALPIETYHAQTARERVTFQVVPVAKVKAPAWWKIYFWSCRPELLGLTLGPAVAAWLNHPAALPEWTRWPSWFALLGILFLHTGVFLHNDVEDHVKGFDRLNRRRGSQVIQKGWVSAQAMQRWAYLNLALAVLFAVPAFFNAPGPLAVICSVALLSLAVVLKNRYARWGIVDLALALLFGPLLTCGIALASFGLTDGRDVALGVGFGALTLWVLQARQLENLFRSKPEGFHTFLGFADFDRARLICIAEGLFLLVLQPAVALALNVPLKFMVLLPLVSTPLILLMGRLWRAASPLSSSLLHSDRWALGSHLAWTAWWVLTLGVTWL
jgi:1,4-dihydroxy-2-naphthoate octaprenyltransferase